jgi:hypothetical protein
MYLNCFKDTNTLQERKIILKIVIEHATEEQVAWGLKCLNSPEKLQSRTSPHPLIVSTVSSPVCHTQTAQRLIAPVALSSCTIQIHVTLSVQILQYSGLTE